MDNGRFANETGIGVTAAAGDALLNVGRDAVGRDKYEHCTLNFGTAAAAAAAVSVAHSLLPSIEPAAGFVGRDDLLPDIKAALLGGSVALLLGLPGVGKTALATRLVYDPELAAHFRGGVLWAGLKPYTYANEPRTAADRERDVDVHLNAMGRALGVDPDGLRGLAVDEKVDVLRGRIHQRGAPFLLFVDNAWDGGSAKLLLGIRSAACAAIVTSRKPEMDLHIEPRPRVFRVPPLDQANAAVLLRNAAGDSVELLPGDPDPIADLVEVSGQLPLALTLIGNWLRGIAISRDPAEVASAVQRLVRRLGRDRTTGFDGDVVRRASALETPFQRLHEVIRLSDSALCPADRQALRALSLFAPKPNSFDAAAALSVAGVADREPLSRLVRSGLVEPVGGGRYALHQSIRDFAAEEAEGSKPQLAAARRFVRHYATLEPGEDAVYRESYLRESANVVDAVRTALARGMQTEALRCLNACFPLIEARGSYLLDDVQALIRGAVSGAVTVRDRSELAQALLNVGRITEKQGDYAAAEQLLTKSLETAKLLRRRDHSLEAAVHLSAGVLAFSRCDYARSGERLLAALAATGRAAVPEPSRRSHIRQWLAAVELARGDLAAARTHIELGWQDVEGAATISGERASGMHLIDGVYWLNAGDPARARTTLLRGLAIAQEIAHRERQVAILQILAAVEHRVDPASGEAERHLARAELDATGLRHCWYLSAVLCEWGELRLRQGRPRDAKASFEQALAGCPAECRDRRAFALAGLSRAERDLADLGAAEAAARESLALFSAIGHAGIGTARFWLVAALMDRAEHAHARGEHALARQMFTEAGDTASARDPDQVAFAMYGLARVAYACGVGDALGAARESLRLFRQIGHPKAEEVGSWIAMFRSGVAVGRDHPGGRCAREPAVERTIGLAGAPPTKKGRMPRAAHRPPPGSR